RVAGGNIRAAKIVGLGVSKLILTICFLAGGAAGLAGMIEVAAVQGRTNANLAAGYGFTGILVAFLARQNPLAIIPVAILLGGAIRISTPFLFVSLGECITERSGRINLGLEGTLVMGAMSAYGISYLSGSPWLGVLAAGITGALLGALHAGICSLPRVNDVAV